MSGGLLPAAAHVLARSVGARVFPGAVVEVGRRAGPIATIAAGALTYEAGAPTADAATVYDLASLTKVVATTAIAVEAAAGGRVALADRVARFLPWWRGGWRDAVTLADLFEHCSGLPGHRPYYERALGREAFARALGAEDAAYPPRTQAVYSDPGFILLGFAIEAALGAALDRLFDDWRARAVPGAEVRFGVTADWRARTAPTELLASGEARRGVVHDENAEALGGVAGHAGLFGTTAAVGACARWWLSHPALVELASRRSAVPGSSRALGWDTMLPTSSCGTRLSPRAIGHTGFTGTSLWIDPPRDLYVVCLSNRVHPTRAGEGMQEVRRALHDAVVRDLEGPAPASARPRAGGRRRAESPRQRARRRRA